MVMANLHGFRALKAMGVSIRQTSAAFCGRPGMVTVVISVSLVTDQVR
jgi:predicted amino acid dehydrogenase